MHATAAVDRTLVQDFIDVGAQCWTSVQPTNDIVALQEQFGDKRDCPT
jgi:hypothetical protein